MVYKSLRRQPAHKRAAETLDRPYSLDLNRGTYKEFLRRHEVESAKAAAATRSEHASRSFFNPRACR